MPDEPAVIAQVRLARSTWRLLLVPATFAALGLLAIAASTVLAGGAALGMLAAGALAIIIGLLAGSSLLSVRLEVDLAVLRLHWLGGERRYVLLRGPVTRITVRGPSASALRPRIGILGWGLGAARLRNEEEIELIRLAPSRSVIAVPTDRGRLAIAPASEEELLAALAGAARVKQRLDEMTGRFGQRPPIRAPMAASAAMPAELTGIERALLEARLAAEGADAVADESLPGPELASAAADASPSVVPVRPRPVRPRRQTEWSRPDWMATVAARRPAGELLMTLVPVVAAGLLWAIARATGHLEGDTSSTRLLVLSIGLAGPVATLGALVARVAWPRLVGLVLLSGLGALLLIGRSLIG
ncbi:MAG: hypothetical protein ABJB65_04665 [Chloroflexota bacterium]